MHWQKVKLGDVCEFQYGKSLPKEKRNEKGSIPVYGSNGIVGYHDEFVVNQPCLIIGRKGSAGEVHFSEGPCFPIDTTYYIVPREINLKFFYYQLKNLGLDSLEKSTSIPGLNRNDAYQKLIFLPPLPTQRAIAARLDRADALRQKDRQLLRAYDDLAQSVFVEMFGDPVRNEKGWEVGKVIDFCDCIVPGRDKPKAFTGHVPWVTTDDLNHLSFTFGSRKKIGLSLTEIQEVRARIIPAGSVLMTCVGDLGIISIAEKDMVVNQQLHAFQCGQSVNNTFLMYVLFSQKSYMYKMASSTTVPYLNKTMCNSIPIIIPPLPLQTRFAVLLANIERQKELVRRQQAESEALFGRLLQEAFG